MEDVAVGEPLAVGCDQVVVEAGLDPVTGLGVVAVGETDPLRSGPPSVRLADLGQVLGGLPVEFGDVGFGLGDHQRVFPGADVGGPVQHHIADGLVFGGGEDTPLYLVVGDDPHVTVAQGEGSLLFPLAGESVHLVQLQRAAPVGEQGEHAARADRAELVFITHGDDAGAAAGGGVGQVQPVGGGDLAGLIQHDHVPRADFRPPADSAVGLLAEEPGQVRCAHLGSGLVHLGGGDAGGVFRHGHHVHGPARGLGPCPGERADEAGLAGARSGAQHGHCRGGGEQGGQRGGLPAAVLPIPRGRGGGGFGAFGVDELRAVCGGGGEDVLFGIELGGGGVPVAARRGVDGLPVRSAGAQVVHVHAGGAGADEHDVDAVDLAGESGGGQRFQQRDRVGSVRQRGEGAVQFPQQLGGAERGVPRLHLGHGDADGPLSLCTGQFGGRRVARSVLGHGGVQVGQDLHPGAARMLLPCCQPLGTRGRIVGLGLAGRAGQVLPPLPPGPRRRFPAVQPLVFGFLGRGPGVDLPSRPLRERVHGGLLHPADLERVAVFLLR